MERMLRVQTVKVAGPGFNSMSPERGRKARTEGLRKRKARWGAKSRKVAVVLLRFQNVSCRSVSAGFAEKNVVFGSV